MGSLFGGSGGLNIPSFFDPGNFFGGRPGGIDIGGAIDPGGEIIYSLTGSDLGRKFADPLGILGPVEGPFEEELDFPEIPDPFSGVTESGEEEDPTESIDIDVQEEFAIEEAEAEEKERRRRAKLLGRESTIKTSPFGLTSEAKTREKKLFGA